MHCNPAELYEPGWKKGNIRNFNVFTKKLIAYPYSSLGSYESTGSPVRPILDEIVFDVVHATLAKRMIREAKEYYLENPDLL